MSKRVLWEVIPRVFGTLGWAVRVRRANDNRWHTEFISDNKAVAIQEAVASCRWWLLAWGENSELRIKNRWGKIQDSRTYGDDPENVRG